MTARAVVDGPRWDWGAVSPLYPMLPLVEWDQGRGHGWNAHRSRVDTFALVPRARFEWDPIAAIALGVEFAVPIAIHTGTGDADVHVQLAVEAAARFETMSLAGVRVEVTSYPDANVLIEPFVRLALINAESAAFVRLALRASLGPAYAFITSRDGSLGGAIEVGLL